MKIVIASDSYKDSMTAAQVCAAIQQGLKRILPSSEYQLLPIADGGEGTMQAIANTKRGTFHHVNVEGPLGNMINAELLQIDDTCIIEVASACGLELLKHDQRNPLITSSFGVGQLIAAALDRNTSKIIIGLGGSATNDGGAGMISALGARFYNNQNELFRPTGGTLNQISHIDLSDVDSRLFHCEIIFASDVSAPLCGENGATYMFAPQKGAKPQDLIDLEQGLLHFDKVLEQINGSSLRSVAGTGAAGGMALPLMSLLNIQVCSGIDVVLDLINFEQSLQGADLVITGEGRVDGQTQHGKAPTGVAKRAKKYDIPVILLCGALAEGYQAVYEHGIDAVYSATPKVLDLPTAFAQAPINLANLSENVARMLVLTKV